MWSMELKGIQYNHGWARLVYKLFSKRYPKIFPATSSANASEASLSDFNFLFNEAWMKTPGFKDPEHKELSLLDYHYFEHTICASLVVMVLSL